MKIRLAIVDDKNQNRLPLANRLMAKEDIDVVFTASDGKDFLDKAALNQPLDVVLMDVEMPVLNGIQTVSVATGRYPNTRFIMLTVFDDEDKIFEAIQAGACGYLLKDDSVHTIYNSIREAIDLGGAPMSPGIARKALQMLSRAQLPQQAKNTKPDEISERELEVLKQLVNGLEYKAIAEKLFISPNTVRKHIDNIYQKLHINSKAQAIRLAMKKRWV